MHHRGLVLSHRLVEHISKALVALSVPDSTAISLFLLLSAAIARPQLPLWSDCFTSFLVLSALGNGKSLLIGRILRLVVGTVDFGVLGHFTSSYLPLLEGHHSNQTEQVCHEVAFDFLIKRAIAA